jgi:hypothetical protein
MPLIDHHHHVETIPSRQGMAIYHRVTLFLHHETAFRPHEKHTLLRGSTTSFLAMVHSLHEKTTLHLVGTMITDTMLIHMNVVDTTTEGETVADTIVDAAGVRGAEIGIGHPLENGILGIDIGDEIGLHLSNWCRILLVGFCSFSEAPRIDGPNLQKKT